MNASAICSMTHLAHHALGRERCSTQEPSDGLQHAEKMEANRSWIAMCVCFLGRKVLVMGFCDCFMSFMLLLSI